MSASSSVFQQVVLAVAAFLTMIGCGLGDTLMQMVNPPNFQPPDAVASIPPEDVAQTFLDRLVDGNYLGASQYLCEEAKPGFFGSDPADNVLLGADISDLTMEITPNSNGYSASLTFGGEVTVFPGSDREMTIPADQLPYDDVSMLLIYGRWVLCPAQLVN